MIDDELATIQFMPVCSVCKQILFETISVDTFYNELTDKHVLYARHTITPQRCPYCETPFISITIPTTLPYDNSLKVSVN